MLTESFEIEQTNKVVVARLTGKDLSGQTMQELIERLNDKMRYDNALYFVLDMKTVQFVASACIGPLVVFLQDLEHVRGRIALANCVPNVQFLFKVTRLDTVFAMYEDVEEACAEIVG